MISNCFEENKGGCNTICSLNTMFTIREQDKKVNNL